jgi:hypothetical protein
MQELVTLGMLYDSGLRRPARDGKVSIVYRPTKQGKQKDRKPPVW